MMRAAADHPRGRLTREILIAVRLLSRGRHTIADLAASLELDRRAAYRLLNALQGAGLRIERHREGRCVYLRLARAEVEDWLWRRPVHGTRRAA